MKLKSLAAVIPLALCGAAADAAIVASTAASGNSSLMFQVVGPTQSYALDLGLTMDDLLTSLSNGTFTTITKTLPNFPTFSDPTNSIWGVVAAEYSSTAGGNPVGQRRLLTSYTSADPSGPPLSISGLSTRAQNFDTINSNVGTLCTAGQPCIASSASDGTYIGATPPWGSQWGFSSGFSNGVGLDSPDSLAFWFFTAASSSGTAQANKSQLMSVTGAPLMATLVGNLLTISAGSVAPVPIPAAVWLLGSGLLGLIGIGRRKHQLA